MTNSSQTKSDDLSLLKYAADPKNFRLHDVLYDWLRRQIAGPTTGWFAALARFFVAALKQGRCGLGRDSTGYPHSRRSVQAATRAASGPLGRRLPSPPRLHSAQLPERALLL